MKIGSVETEVVEGGVEDLAEVGVFEVGVVEVGVAGLEV